MSRLDVRDLTFLNRNVFSCGNAKGGIAAVPLTVWRHKNGAICYIPDNPKDLPALKKMLKRELPDD